MNFKKDKNKEYIQLNLFSSQKNIFLTNTGIIILIISNNKSIIFLIIIISYFFSMITSNKSLLSIRFIFSSISRD